MKQTLAVIALAVLLGGCVSESRYAQRTVEANQAHDDAMAARMSASQSQQAAQAAQSRLNSLEATLQARILDAQSVNQELENEYYQQSLEALRWQMLLGARLHAPARP